MNRRPLSLFVLAFLVVPLCAGSVCSSELTKSLREGKPDLQSAGPLAFGPDGILFIADPRGAAIFAIATTDTGKPSEKGIAVSELDKKVAAALGTTPEDVLVNDLAINPRSGNAYLSISRGRGPEGAPVIARVDAGGKIHVLSLDKVKFSKAALPNAPGPEAVGRRNRSLRLESITDLAYIDGRLLVAGLSNEEFASTLRSIAFPFKKVDRGTSVEIYHGAHGRFETRSPVRTFVSYQIDKKPHVLAAYTCTPLVKFSLDELEPGKHIKGTTIAELGNRNRPLDMIVYEKAGKDYLLLANSARGVMKITTDNIGTAKAITERVARGEREGVPYETIESWKEIHQLDRLDDKRAVVVRRGEDGALHLETMPLP